MDFNSKLGPNILWKISETFDIFMAFVRIIILDHIFSRCFIAVELAIFIDDPIWREKWV